MTHRDDVRAERTRLNNEGKELGIDMEAERSKQGANERTLTFETVKLINSATPRVNRERQQVDDPPEGAFNSANTSFQLSQEPAGENIVLIWHDSTTNVQWVLTRTNATGPATHEFYYNSIDPLHIIVGDPPAAGDSLVAVYVVQR